MTEAKTEAMTEAMTEATTEATTEAKTETMTADIDIETDDAIECTRKRTLDGAARCLALMLGALARDWLYCGKASCARARRCRGFACEPESDGPMGPAASGAQWARRGGRPARPARPRLPGP
jgi:hypothetical protein